MSKHTVYAVTATALDNNDEGWFLSEEEALVGVYATREEATDAGERAVRELEETIASDRCHDDIDAEPGFQIIEYVLKFPKKQKKETA